MRLKTLLLYSGISLIHCLCTQNLSAQHDVIFCGERIPVNNDLVSRKLMDVIRRQIPNINMPELRKRRLQYFPWLEQYLRQMGLPEDLKYIAIVESGFQNLTSSAGASGFWQLMPLTARGAGLNVSAGADDRENFYKSTYAACRVLSGYYSEIRRKFGISSWVLTAAAYNFGIGNMRSNITRQGQDYFSMNLNPETAVYVYKIIAVKELFEYPEFYLKDFGYNIFKTIQQPPDINLQQSTVDSTIFNSIEVNVNVADEQHPDSISTLNQPIEKPKKYIYIGANIKGKYKDITDGQVISITLQEDLQVKGVFNSKGNIITTTAWIIDDRIFMDLGREDHDVVVLSYITGKRGIERSELKNDQLVILRIEAEDAE